MVGSPANRCTLSLWCSANQGVKMPFRSLASRTKAHQVGQCRTEYGTSNDSSFFKAGTSLSRPTWYYKGSLSVASRH